MPERDDPGSKTIKLGIWVVFMRFSSLDFPSHLSRVEPCRVVDPRHGRGSGNDREGGTSAAFVSALSILDPGTPCCRLRIRTLKTGVEWSMIVALTGVWRLRLPSAFGPIVHGPTEADSRLAQSSSTLTSSWSRKTGVWEGSEDAGLRLMDGTHIVSNMTPRLGHVCGRVMHQCHDAQNRPVCTGEM